MDRKIEIGMVICLYIFVALDLSTHYLRGLHCAVWTVKYSVGFDGVPGVP
jgi:hypothetical protein